MKTLRTMTLLLVVATFLACEKDEDPEIVVSADFSFTPANALAPATITFTSNCQGALQYAWDFNDGTTSTEANPVHEFLEAGTYKVMLTAKNADKYADVTKTVTIGEPLPVAAFEIEGDGKPAPAVVTFKNISQNVKTYLWNFGDGNSSSSESPIHTYSNPGSYVVKLTVTNSSGSNATEKSVTIREEANIIPGESIGIYNLGDTWTNIVNKINEDYYQHLLVYMGGYYYHLCTFENTGVSFFFRTTSSTLLSTSIATVVSAFEPFDGRTEKGITFGSLVSEVITQYGTPSDEQYSTLYYDALGIEFSYDDNREKIDEISIYEVSGKKSTVSMSDIIDLLKKGESTRVQIR